MKAICSTQYEDGTWREVGMVGRCILHGSTLKKIQDKARAFSHGKPYRLEVFANGNIQGKPSIVAYGNM